ncbi:RNA polymerase sigma factor containing a TPR repeat domain [Perkinsela sp. CCAP 1560/4]|nr:RNA polymerase sigma factor containing a TPR repeat domain [Perkinsela sp. CCAP 1560/4]|eukprot:KNH09710.1 RNA polymerase sigma factor containing a TPR repeat domain [Perkinsela sp. CCAP 1560/4]
MDLETLMTSKGPSLSERVKRMAENPDSNIGELNAVMGKMLFAGHDDDIVKVMSGYSSLLARRLAKTLVHTRLDQQDRGRFSERLSTICSCSEALLTMTLFFGVTVKDFQCIFDRYRAFFLQNLSNLMALRETYIAFTFALCTTMTSSMKLTFNGLVTNPLIGKVSLQDRIVTDGSITVTYMDVTRGLYEEVKSAQLEPVAESTAYQLLNVLCAFIALFEGKADDKKNDFLDLLLSAVSTDSSGNALIPECVNANIFRSLHHLCRPKNTYGSVHVLTAKCVHGFVHDIFSNMPQVLYKAFEIDKQTLTAHERPETVFSTLHASLVPVSMAWSFEPERRYTMIHGMSTLGLLQLCQSCHAVLRNHYSFPGKGIHIASLNKSIRDYLQKYILYFIEDCLLADSAWCVMYGVDLLSQYYSFLSECIVSPSTAHDIFDFLDKFRSKQNILSIQNVVNNLSQEALLKSALVDSADIPKVSFLTRIQGLCLEKHADPDTHESNLSPITLLCVSFLRLFEVLTVFSPPTSLFTAWSRSFGLQEISIRLLAFSTNDMILHSAFTFLAALARSPTTANSILQSVIELRLLSQDSTNGLQRAQSVDRLDASSPLCDIYSEFTRESQTGTYLRTIGYLSLVRWIVIASNRARTFSFTRENIEHANLQWNALSERLTELLQCVLRIIRAIKRHFMAHFSLDDGMWILLSLCCEICVESFEENGRLMDWADLISEVESFALIFHTKYALSIHAERGIARILYLVIHFIESSGSLEKGQHITDKLTKNAQFRTLLIHLLEAHNASLRCAASKCFFLLQQRKGDTSQLIAQWQTEKSAVRMSEILRREMFAQPDTDNLRDDMYVLARNTAKVSEIQPHLETSIVESKIHVIRNLLEMCAKEDLSLPNLVLGYGDSSDRSGVPLHAALHQMKDTSLWQCYPEYYAACLEAFYVLLSDPCVTPAEIISLRVDAISTIVNALCAYTYLTPLQFGWFLHLCSFLIRVEGVEHKFIPPLCDYVMQLGSEIPHLEGKYRKYIALSRQEHAFRYDLALLDKSALYEQSGDFTEDMIQILAEQNSILEICDQYLIILRGWALFVRAIIEKDVSTFSDSKVCIKYLSVFWHGLATLSKKAKGLPLSSKTRHIVAGSLYSFLVCLARHGIVARLPKEQKARLIRQTKESINEWKNDRATQKIGVQCLMLLLKQIDTNEGEFCITAELANTLANIIMEEAALPNEYSLTAFRTLEILIRHTGTANSVILESRLRKTLIGVWQSSQEGAVMALEKALNIKSGKDIDFEPYRQQLIALCSLCHAVMGRDIECANLLLEYNLIAYVRSSTLVKLLQSESIHQIMVSRQGFREALSALIHPIFRLFTVYGQAVGRTNENSSIPWQIAETMKSLQRLNSIILQVPEKPLEKGDTCAVQHDLLDVLLFLCCSNLPLQNQYFLLDPSSLNAVLYALVQPSSWTRQTIAERSSFIFKTTEILRFHWNPLKNCEENRMRLDLVYLLILLANRITDVLPTILGDLSSNAYSECSVSLLAAMIDSIENILYIVREVLHSHPTLAPKNLPTYRTLLNRMDSVPKDILNDPNMLKFSEKQEQECFALVWQAVYEYCEKTRVRDVFDKTLSRKLGDSVYSARGFVESLIKEYTRMMQ